MRFEAKQLAAQVTNLGEAPPAHAIANAARARRVGERILFTIRTLLLMRASNLPIPKEKSIYLYILSHMMIMCNVIIMFLSQHHINKSNEY